MKSQCKRIIIFVVSVFVMLIFSVSLAQEVSPPTILDISEAELDIDERIERYRKGPALLHFVDSTGNNLENINVEIEQTGHDFLFGLNHSFPMWYVLLKKELGDEVFDPMVNRKFAKYSLANDKARLCLDQFYTFANYTMIPVSWPIYEPKRDRINYELYDETLSLMQGKGFACLAHNLVWHHNTPDWVPDDTSGMLKAVEERITDFCSYYKHRFDYLLVVNEPAQPFRPTLAGDKLAKLYKNPGQVPFVSRALEWSRSAYPKGEFMVNEVAVLEKQGFPDLLDKLTDDSGNSLFDVIGIQSHMHHRIWPLPAVWDLCDLYARFDVPIHFTEVTVCSGMPMSGDSRGEETTPEGEQMQADYVVDFYKLLFSHPAVEAINWWNFSDLWAIKNSPGGLLRKDMTPKPAFHKLMDLIHHQWQTHLARKTSEDGTCSLRGFYGTYRVSAQGPDREKHVFEFELLRDKDNHFTFTLKD